MSNIRRMRLPWVSVLVATIVSACGQAGTYIIVANDEKVLWDDAGKFTYHAPGSDTVSIIDISARESPRIVKNLPLMNTVLGPPNNVVISPDRSLALVANSMSWVQEPGGWKPVPGNQIHILDLSSRTPTAVGVVDIDPGTQPSGLAISASGKMGLTANRAGKSVTVLSIDGFTVKPVATIAVGGEAAAVAFTPDGKRALVTKFDSGKVAILHVDGQQVRYTGVDIDVGPFPYPVAITPDGKIALVGILGARTGSDGVTDNVAVLDLEQDPPKLLGRVDVGDAPEGLAISPDGRSAVVVILRGSNAARDAPYRNAVGGVVALRIDGKNVSRSNEVLVGALPEGITYSPDSRYVYVGNYLSKNLSVLRFDEGRLVDTGQTLALPGHPAALR